MKLNRRILLSCIFISFSILIIKLYINAYGNEPPEIIDQRKEEENVINDKCVYDNSCPLPQMMFRTQTETESAPPFACINDIKLFDAENINRGINVAVLNGSTGEVLETKTFDVRASDEKLMRWMANLPQSCIIVAASFGDVAEHVSHHARRLFSAYGAQKIENWRGGSAYSIIGQRGIAKGSAYETISPFSDSDKEQKRFEGCFELPIADTKPVNLAINVPDMHRADETKLAELGAFEDDLVKKNEVTYGPNWKNCGMEKACGEETISIHMFSGEHKEDHPKMCVGGRMLFDKDLNNAGRGLNLAMLEPKTAKVTAVAHFDTYEDESKGLEEWLDAIPTGYIVVVISFDEASNMLSDMARRIFYEMGSSMIDRLKFRASWYFIGQKGIGAYTPFEDLNIPTGNNWATPVKASFCLPKSLSKWAGRKDSLLSGGSDGRNLPKRHFCAKYDRHEEFCHFSRLDEPIVPRILHDEKRANDKIFNVPILIASGLAPDSLRATLQSLMNQEGVNTQMVLVTYDKEYPENADLAALFHVKSVAISSNGSYNTLLYLSLSNAFSIYPDAKSLIVIEEDVSISADWLRYFSSIYDTFLADDSVDIAQAFNPNGFEDLSGSSSSIYRIHGHVPIGSYILKRDLYEKYIRLREFCCTERGNWDLRDGYSLVPALSRIDIRVDELEKTNILYSRSRVSSKSADGSIDVSSVASNDNYDKFIKKMVLKTKTRISSDDLIRIGCDKWKKNVLESETSIVITYSDRSDAERLLTCLRYYFTPKILRTNKIFRFSIRSTEIIVIPEKV